MSASLVGSEMCIRDRFRSLASSVLPTMPEPRLDPASSMLECTGQGSLPVSYTHLTLPTICSV
eukprot:15355668-Alexandrium_andersonii.AAC.1